MADYFINTTIEWWSPINGIDGYLISNKGRVFASYRKVIMKPKINSCGYNWYLIGRKFTLLHRIVAKAFVPNPDNKPFVNHIDGNKLNNEASNLEWVTASENMLHAYQNGLRPYPKGELNPTSKLSQLQVNEIRVLAKNGVKQKEVARLYGVHPTVISKIINNKRYL